MFVCYFIYLFFLSLLFIQFSFLVDTDLVAFSNVLQFLYFVLFRKSYALVFGLLDFDYLPI